jgi:hypothetical protein
MTKTTMFGVERCLPCNELKRILDKAGTLYEYLLIGKLSPIDREHVRLSIYKISGIKDLYAPAVRVEKEGEEPKWFTHWGRQENVPTMAADVLSYVNS